LSDATTEDGKASGTNTSEPLQVYFSGQFHASVGNPVALQSALCLMASFLL
jgi:hypothetical protein